MSAAAVNQHITCEVDGTFLIVTLNRPDKLNAYTGGWEIARLPRGHACAIGRDMTLPQAPLMFLAKIA